MKNEKKSNDHLLEQMKSQFPKNGWFRFSFTSNLSKETKEVPGSGSSGIYLIYSENQEGEELIYVGISGQKLSIENQSNHRKDGFRGRFTTGKQFGEKRQHSWPKRMKLDEIGSIKVYWFVTWDDTIQVLPLALEKQILER